MAGYLDGVRRLRVRRADPAGAGPVDIYYRVFAAELLDRIYVALDRADPAQRDAKLYVTVARVLLHDPSDTDAFARGRLLQEVWAQRLGPVLAAIANQRLATVELLGAEVEHDFSQFIPRGHYTHSESLRRTARGEGLTYQRPLSSSLFSSGSGSVPS